MQVDVHPLSLSMVSLTVIVLFYQNEWLKCWLVKIHLGSKAHRYYLGVSYKEERRKESYKSFWTLKFQISQTHNGSLDTSTDLMCMPEATTHFLFHTKYLGSLSYLMPIIHTLFLSLTSSATLLFYISFYASFLSFLLCWTL